MAKCSYCKRNFDKEDLIEHHKSYKPEKTIKICKDCHFTLHIDKITNKKSCEYESIQMELDELHLKINKLRYKIENKVSYPVPICKKYNIVCWEAFVTCSADQPEIWKSYNPDSSQNEDDTCEACPHRATNEDYWNFLEGVIKSHKSRYSYLNERKPTIAKQLNRLKKFSE